MRSSRSSNPGFTATFRLDPFLPWPNRSINAGDWALVGTHYYANKAPGTILFGVLAYWPAYLLETSLGVLGNSGRRHLDAYWINLCVSVMPLAVASLLWCRLLARRISAARAATLTLLTFSAVHCFRVRRSSCSS
jgi:hypothetical protein